MRSVRALERQTWRDFEVVVVVDGATDGTATALAQLDVEIPVTVLEQANAGGAAARNAGAAAAKGELLLFLDDDMEADPSLLAEHERCRREGAELVLGDIPLHPGSPRNVLSRGVGVWAASRRDRLSADATVIRVDDLLTGQMSISREAFARVGGFDEDFTRAGLYGGEDLDFGYRVLEAGYRVAFNPRAVSYQYYDVDPADFLRRAYEAGRSEAELTVKHPRHNGPLGRDRRYRSRLGRWILQPLAAAPKPFRWPLLASTVWLVRTGRGGQRLQQIFRALRTMEHLRGQRDARRVLATGRAWVLAYHMIADLRGDPVMGEFAVPRKRLVEQLDALARQGWRFIDLETLLDALNGRRSLPKRSLLVTFDDAYADLLSDALPTLRERQIPAVTFVVTGQVGGTNAWDRGPGAGARRLLDAEGILEVARHGVEIGSHTVSHRRLAQLPPLEQQTELAESATHIERLGLPRPRVVAYPYGVWSRDVATAACDAGYLAAFGVASGVVDRSSPRYALPRVEVFASDTPRKLRVKLAIAGCPLGLRKWVGRVIGTRV